MRGEWLLYRGVAEEEDDDEFETAEA